MSVRSVQASSWLIYASRLVSVGLTFAIVLIIARTVGPTGTGEYAVAMATSGVLVQFGNFGLSSAILYFVSRRPRRAGSMLTLAAFWSLLASTMGFALAPLLTRLGLSRDSVPLISVWAGLQMALLFLDQILLALRQFFQSGVLQVGRRVAALVLTAALVVAHAVELRHLILAAVIGDCLALAAGVVLLRRAGVQVQALRPKLMTQILGLGLRAFPVLVLPFLLFRSDILLLTSFRGPQQTGVYAVAAQMVDALLLLPAAFGGVLFVALSEVKEAPQQVLAGVRRVLLLVLAIAALLAGVGPVAIPSLFGQGFAPAYPMLLLLLPGAIGIAVETQVAQYFGRQGYPWFLSRAWLVGLIVNFSLNLAIIPRLGGLGAALTSTVAYLIVTALVLGRYSRETGTLFRNIVRGARLDAPGAARPPDLAVSLFPLTDDSLSGYPALAAADRMALSNLPLKDLGRLWSQLRARRQEVTFVFLGSGDGWQHTLADGVMILLNSARKTYLYVDSGTTKRFTVGMALVGFVSLATGIVRGLAAVFMNAVGSAYLAGRQDHRPSGRRSGGAGGRAVAYLRASFPMPRIGGSVGHARGVIAALARRGMDVTVFASAPPCVLPEGVAFRPMKPSRFVSPIHELNSHSQARRYFRQVRRSVRGDDFSFLYQRYVLNDLSGVRLARRLRVPLVLEFNGSEVWVARNWSERRLVFDGLSTGIENNCVRSADLVVAVSDALGQELTRRGVSPERVLVYPNAVDPDVFDPRRFGPADVRRTREALKVPDDAILFTHVGTFGPWHGAEIFARAIRELPLAVDRRRLHFLFVGDGSRASETRSLLSAEIEAGRVTMAGSRPQGETPAILAASDVLVSPHVPNPDGSAFFGSPTKLFEYMAMSKVIVASDLDQVGKVVRGWTPNRPAAAEPCGLLVPPGDWRALSAALLAVASLPLEEARRLGQSARDRVLQAFTWAHHVEAITNRLRELFEREGLVGA